MWNTNELYQLLKKLGLFAEELLRTGSRRNRERDDIGLALPLHSLNYFAGLPHSSDTRKDLLRCELMEARRDAAACVRCQDDAIVEIEGGTRGGFHAEVGGDTADHDSLAASTPKLHIKFSTEEGAHLSLGDADGCWKRVDFWNERRELCG